jgi:hypothetical protein
MTEKYVSLIHISTKLAGHDFFSSITLICSTLLKHKDGFVYISEIYFSCLEEQR